MLDVSLDVNRAGLTALLDRGVSVRYFDHHFAGEIPAHPGLEAHIDLSPNICTSLIVDRSLDGRFRPWAIVGAFGDSMTAEADALVRAVGLAPDVAARLKALGIAINYNAYGETIADLHVPPVELAAEMLPFVDPMEFAETSAACKRLADGFRDDMELAKRLDARARGAGRGGFHAAGRGLGAPRQRHVRKRQGEGARRQRRRHRVAQDRRRLPGVGACSARFLRLCGGVLS